MRYIPERSGDVIVQVPEDKNAYVNVKNIGATGRGDLEFTGTITDIDSEGIVTISNIDDGAGNSLFQYQDILKSGVGIQLFGYNDPTTVDSPLLSVLTHTKVGVDFSNLPGANTNLAPLTYYVFGFDPQTGRLPFSRSVVNIGTKVLNPDLWGTEQYVQLNFSRVNQYALPIIYRIWGNKVDFLGVIGNNKVGYPGNSSDFRDLGILEIPSWDGEPVMPSYLSNVFSVAGTEVFQVKKVKAKESLRILPNLFGSLPSYIQCNGLSVSSQLTAGDTVRFIIDDTLYVRNAINLASTTEVKEVFLPSGIYNVSDMAFVNTSQRDFSNISLRGVGDGSIIRRLPCTQGNPTNPGVLNFTGQSISPRISGIRVKSIAIDGNRSESFSQLPPVTTEVGLQIQYGDNVVINDCTVTECGGGGIALYDTRGAVITNNAVEVTGRSYEQTVSPLLIDTSENIVVQGNRLEFATTGPRVISTEYSTINGNIIRGCGDRGIILETSFQWNTQGGNLAYSDNDSIIRSIDTYNNEYSRAAIEVRKGFALDPVYMTVTYGGESVQIYQDSVKAKIFTLNSSGVKDSSSPAGYFRVLQTSDQLDAGIFSLTLPGGTTNELVGSDTVLATGNLNDPDGYVYEVTADIKLGNGTRGYQTSTIRKLESGGVTYTAIGLRNSSDILSFQIFSSTSSQNDKIIVTDTLLSGWDSTISYQVVGINPETNSILLSSIPSLNLSTEPVTFTGSLFIVRTGYFVADGNLIVHSL